MFRRYVAKYVRKAEVFERLAAIPPSGNNDEKFKNPGYSPKALMVESAQSIICLIDITAYSKLTAILAQRLGRFGSELISDTVGKYLSQIIDLIEKDKGDVVKFLVSEHNVVLQLKPGLPIMQGDAMLVRFDVAELCRGTWSHGQTQIPAAAVKHVIDCCLDILSIYHEYSVDFQTLHRPASAKNSSSNTPGSKGQIGNSSSANLGIGIGKDDLKDLEGYKLSLHIGIVAGVVDYLIAGPPLAAIGDLLNAAKSGELSLPTSLWEAFEAEFPIFIRGKAKHLPTGGITVITKSDGQNTFNPGITMPTTRSGRRSSLVPLPSSVVRNVSQSEIQNLASFSQEAQVVFRQFVNASLVNKIEHSSSSRENVSAESEELSEYSLSRFDGVLQQFSVDDKGTTMLAAFGLPPFTHENECDFALKCALDIEEKMKAMDLAPFSISLATGDTLFSVLGNQTRSEAGLLSDVVVIAARLMDLDVSHNIVVCDDATKAGIGKEESADSYVCVGTFQLKGRSDYLPVWKVVKPTRKAGNIRAFRSSGEQMIGYSVERETIRCRLEGWKSSMGEDGRSIIIEGDSGIGKSYLAYHFQQFCRSNNIPVCLASAIEIEKATPHFIFQSVITQLFMIVARHQQIFGLPADMSMVKTVRRMSDGVQAFRSSNRNGSVPNSRFSSAYPSHNPSGVSSPDRRRSMASTTSSTTARRKLLLPSHLSGYAPVVSIVTDAGTSMEITADDRDNSRGNSSIMLSSSPNEMRVADDQDMKVAGDGSLLVDPNNASDNPARGRLSIDTSDEGGGVRQPAGSLLTPSGGGGLKPLGLFSDQVTGSFQNIGLKNSLNPGSMVSFGSSLRSGMGQGSMLSIFSSGVEPQAEAVISIMNKLGESEYTPLLNFLPWFLVDESETTRNLNQTARSSMTVALMARIIEKVSSRLKIVIMLDNAQWIDTFSLEVLLALLKPGQKSFVMIFTRSITDVHLGQLLRKVTDIPTTILLKMRGFSEADVEEMIKQQYGETVVSVDTTITKTIYKKCGGHPFFSLQLIQALKDFGKDYISVTPARRLAIMSKNFDLDHLLVNDVQTAIMAQFDRLHPEFQRLLKAASVMGQYFDLEDLAGVLDDGNDVKVETLESVITSYDVHGFLAKVNDEELTGIKDEDTTKSYGFKNVLILTSILGSMPVSQKQVLHGKIAQVIINESDAKINFSTKYFESSLNDENANILLPTISFHYSNSTNMPKCIDYLELLAFFQMDIRLYSESANTIEFLLNVLYRSSDRDIRELFPNGPPTAERKAHWLALLAESRNSLRQSTEALSKLKSALNLIGNPWPGSVAKTKLMLWRKRAKFLVFLPSIQKGKPKPSVAALDHYKLQIRIMSALAESFAWESALHDSGLAIFILVRFAVATCSRTKLTDALLKAALWFRRRGWINASKKYQKESEKLKSQIREFDHQSIVADLTTLLYMDGQIDICLDLCKDMICKNPDVDTDYTALAHAAAILQSKGKFVESRNLLLSDCEKILALEDPFAQALLFIFVLQNTVLLNDVVSYADNARDWFASSAEKLLQNYIYMNFSVMASLSVHYLHHKEWSKALSTLSKLPSAFSPCEPCVIESAILLSFYFCFMMSEKNIVLSTADRQLILKTLQKYSYAISRNFRYPIHTLEPLSQCLLFATGLISQNLQAQAYQHLQRNHLKYQQLLKDRPLIAALYYAIMIKFRSSTSEREGSESHKALSTKEGELLSSLQLKTVDMWLSA
ncbi:hypothetical protein HDU97_000091 [Phlyctochytrium planicorne]|nr:hypothetical protein HDU97_000091 [Phlyctochytrium planicorne]